MTGAQVGAVTPLGFLALEVPAPTVTKHLAILTTTREMARQIAPADPTRPHAPREKSTIVGDPLAPPGPLDKGEH